MTADGRLYGLSGASLPKVEDIAAAGRTGLMQRLPVENGDLIVIPNQTSQNLFVFGAGHLAQPVARMAAMIGFRRDSAGRPGGFRQHRPGFPMPTGSLS